jgi:hypothetical protein
MERKARRHFFLPAFLDKGNKSSSLCSYGQVRKAIGYRAKIAFKVQHKNKTVQEDASKKENKTKPKLS